MITQDTTKPDLLFLPSGAFPVDADLHIHQSLDLFPGAFVIPIADGVQCRTGWLITRHASDQFTFHSASWTMLPGEVFWRGWYRD